VTPPGLDHFFYGTGGADANENAVKMARAVTGRHKILARYRSYHGATYGAMSLTGDQRRWASEPGMAGVVRYYDPYKYRSLLYREGDSDDEFTARCLAQIEETLMFEGPHTVAAILMETVTERTTSLCRPTGICRACAPCDRYGILLIYDSDDGLGAPAPGSAGRGSRHDHNGKG
jgi:taurine--2-oxoglutarate transaminase